MSELSIKIRIAEREYPMRVKEEEEERLRIVGKLLNERLKFFKDQFGWSWDFLGVCTEVDGEDTRVA